MKSFVFATLFALAAADPAADPQPTSDPGVLYGGLYGGLYGYPAGVYNYGLGYPYVGGYTYGVATHGKRSADPEPTADPQPAADPHGVVAAGYYPYGVGYYNYGLGYPYYNNVGYYGHSVIGKRSADPEPAASHPRYYIPYRRRYYRPRLAYYSKYYKPYGKRSAEPEPTSNPGLIYGGYYGYPTVGYPYTYNYGLYNGVYGGLVNGYVAGK